MSQISEVVNPAPTQINLSELPPSPTSLSLGLTAQQAIAYALQYLRRDLVIEYLTSQKVSAQDAENKFQACRQLIETEPLILQTLALEWNVRIGQTWQDDLKNGKITLTDHWNEGVRNVFGGLMQPADNQLHFLKKGKGDNALPDYSQEQLTRLLNDLEFVPGFYDNIDFTQPAATAVLTPRQATQLKHGGLQIG
ncbi:MAG: hypothetical protein A3J62_02995 [Candidatus Buchananbacteria bacterium RIFCSPHIGHO2_02_FULL_38_8]|uniref:Uncharacterized protein n=2 Tax=Patescibacteria group TaxID=1783273 RepID=A0A1F7I1R5_9BACT|nr:MAG: hypothetical protein A3F03_03900 [Candidatus Roizmanbacteria bacterium RIFCSPHIGHO2_12_FULL_41_11]OGY47477.1 MAG: hypothetical protein A3J62_02995 [Candidatus Buchananbacteria bacterium RIFCSPHIGHO2_02_FULL_38_8]